MLNPLRSEGEAFRLLLYTIVVARSVTIVLIVALSLTRLRAGP